MQGDEGGSGGVSVGVGSGQLGPAAVVTLETAQMLSGVGAVMIAGASQDQRLQPKNTVFRGDGWGLNQPVPSRRAAFMDGLLLLCGAVPSQAPEGEKGRGESATFGGWTI